MEAGSGEPSPGEEGGPPARAGNHPRPGSDARGPDAHARPRPLYKRLPRGPHRLDRRAVAAHQRLRVQGAMVQAVAGSGYDEVSVRLLIALAGVSRRSFYEQFASKQECFLATFDLIARQQLGAVRRACSETPGGAERRLRAALASCAESVAGDREAAALVLIDALTLGAPGARRLRGVACSWERLLAGCLAGTALAPTPAGATACVLLGGLHGIMSARLRDASPPAQELLAEQLSWWALSSKMPVRPADAKGLGAWLRDGARRGAAAAPGTPAASAAGPSSDRERLLDAALRLAAREQVTLLSAAQIADEAGLPPAAFFELFADRDACLRAALADAGGRLLALAAGASEPGPGWPAALHETLARMLGHLAAQPLHARALAVLAPGAGSACRRQGLALEAELSARLSAGFPCDRRLAGEALVGALMHLVRCHLADRRIRQLPAAAGHLTLLALAPALGADAAAAALLERG